MSRRRNNPAPDLLQEATDLSGYAVAMFDHAVDSLAAANASLAAVAADTQEEIDRLKNRQEIAIQLSDRNDQVISRLKALVA